MQCSNAIPSKYIYSLLSKYSNKHTLIWSNAVERTDIFRCRMYKLRYLVPYLP